jgi:uncharacterized membrane protein YphA (DoxX/SURF4 family)
MPTSIFKIAIVVVSAFVVNCRNSLVAQSPETSTLRTLLLAQSSLPLHQSRLSPRRKAILQQRFAGRMQEAEEKIKTKLEEDTSSGPLESLVLTVRDVVGEESFQKLRAKVIKEHSNVIRNFVETSDSEFGQNVLKRMFEIADKDGNGSLDREELKEAMKAMGFVATTDKDLDRIMKKTDKDKNEVIDYDEFVEAAPVVLRNQLTQLAKANGEDLGFLVSPKKASPEVSDDFQDNLTELGYAFARIAVAALMIHHGQEKLIDPATFTKYTLDKQFAFLPGPHIWWAYLIGSIQWIAPAFVATGVFSRLAALALVAVMGGAFAQGIMAGGFEGFPFFELQGLSAKMAFKVPAFHNYGFETPLLYISAFLLVAAAGPGKFSLAQLLGFNDDKTLLGKLKQ